jgi:hypothetical protein
MTASFSLSSIDSATLEWPDIPGADSKLDVLVPTPQAPASSRPGWQQLGACMDELAATKALNQLFDVRSKAMHDRADMCLRASFTIECGPSERRPGAAMSTTVPYRNDMSRNESAPLPAQGRFYSPPNMRSDSRTCGNPSGQSGAAVYGGLYGLTQAEAQSLQGGGDLSGVQSWLANLAPLATLALLLGAWFFWLN